MAKYKFRINRVEYYEMDVVVEASSREEAIEKMDAEWQDDNGYLYEKLTDCAVDSNTFFSCGGLATKEETEYLINID